MSQKLVYNVLKKLGGKASSIEIREYIRDNVPNTKVHLYCTHRLQTLVKKGILTKEDKYYKIIDKKYFLEL